MYSPVSPDVAGGAACSPPVGGGLVVSSWLSPPFGGSFLSAMRLPPWKVVSFDRLTSPTARVFKRWLPRSCLNLAQPGRDKKTSGLPHARQPPGLDNDR